MTIGTGFAAINDSPDDGTTSQLRVFFLDAQCKVTGVYTDTQQPRDPEDLAIAPDETLWVADIGDNYSAGINRRATVALWRIPSGEGVKRGRAQIFRMKYPDGAHDGEALLFNGDGTPIIVTKGADSGIYVPSVALAVGVEVPLKKVGTFTPARTGTSSGFLGVVGQGLVTAGTNSPDGTKVALRTYSDAYEWDVRDGDVIAALKGNPRITPLPDEPQGEAIAYSADGKALFTVSETARLPADQKAEILRYTPTASGQKITQQTPEAKESPFWDSLSLSEIGFLIAGFGLLGLFLVIIGVIGVRSSRKRQASEDMKRTPSQSRSIGTARIPERPVGTAKIPYAATFDPLSSATGIRHPETDMDFGWDDTHLGWEDPGPKRSGTDARASFDGPNVGPRPTEQSGAGIGPSKGGIYGRPIRPGVAHVDTPLDGDERWASPRGVARPAMPRKMEPRDVKRAGPDVRAGGFDEDFNFADIRDPGNGRGSFLQ
ncbi:MAG: hypothetical protein H0T78_08690 [Longispora sp.]|nr:hypothetical protein [Longispora sp. (in: high G+C Gram-positive bacteria)]